MKKIESRMIDAIAGRHNVKLGNTEVTSDTAGDVRVYLFGNNIASVSRDGSWSLCNLGWNTSTTKSRLNAILDYLKPGAKISSSDWTWFFREPGKPARQLNSSFVLNGGAGR